jgi:cyanophycinase
MGDKIKGRLMIIGGAEDKQGKQEILSKVAHLVSDDGGRLVIITTATEKPEDVGLLYKRVFKELGLSAIDIVDINSRSEANDEQIVRIIGDASGLFFTGGDQLRITSVLGGTKVYSALHEAYERGVLIVGTSAGASAMSDNMIVEGSNDDTPKKSVVRMAPGMGLLEEVVIDQHFAQRGRIGRLLGAIAQNPYILGVGIDEDTAILVGPEPVFEVFGSQTVTVVDGSRSSYSNVSELAPVEPLAFFNVSIHILPAGCGFDLKQRIPRQRKTFSP